MSALPNQNFSNITIAGKQPINNTGEVIITGTNNSSATNVVPDDKLDRKPTKLTYQKISGVLIGPITIDHLHYDNKDEIIDIQKQTLGIL